MENIFLVIVTDDKEYGRALSLAMLSICRSFIIKIFTAEAFFRQKCQADVILWDGEEAKRSYGGRIVYLAEKSSDTVKNLPGKRFCLYKYSTAACIVASVFEIYEALTGRCAVNLRQQDVRLFAFASPLGGAGCTTIAMAFGQELCRFQGKHVLYLSFEEIESTGNFISYDLGIKGVGVFLYHLFKPDRIKWGESDSRQEKLPFLDGYVVRDDYGMEAFAPVQGRNPLRELNPDELHKFISSLIDSGRYDVILMDLGNWLSKASLSCMEMAEQICFVASHRDRGIREEQYISHMISYCGEDILEKFVKVFNMMPQGGFRADDAGEGMVDAYMDISRCGTIAREGKIKKVLLEGAFGDDISRLAKRMTEPE